MSYGFVYRWDNLVTGMSYIGKHKGSEHDGYIGSGYYFKKDYHNYPEDLWERTILYRGSDFTNKETEWVIKEDAISSPIFYNAMQWGPGFMIRDQRTTDKMKETLSRRRKGEGNPMYQHDFSDQHRVRLGKVHEVAEAIQCPHCERFIKNSAGGYTRFHGDNCKMNPDRMIVARTAKSPLGITSEWAFCCPVYGSS